MVPTRPKSSFAYEYHRLENESLDNGINIRLESNEQPKRSFFQMISFNKRYIAIGVFSILLLLFLMWPKENPQNPKLLLISFDGFRYDLLNKTMVPNIYHWAQRSTWFVNGSKSQFMTMTAPNHLSIVTGLYEENHGVTGNTFYIDKETSIDYYGSPDAQKRSQKLVQSSSYLEGDPIWLTNERAGNGRRSSVYFWPFCEAYFKSAPHQPKVCEPWKEYGTKSKLMIEIDNIAEEFARSSQATNFVAWYVDQPDTVLHKKGFFTGDFEKVIKELDFVFNYLITKFEEKRLLDKVDIILTADHGHTEIPDYKHVLCIRDFVKGEFRYGDLKIYPENEQHEEEIYKNLTEGIKKTNLKVNVYRIKDFPERHHYKNTPRAGGIVIEPEIGYTATFKCTSDDQEKTFGPGGSEFHSSTHGHNPDNKEMRAFLIMGGPSFKAAKQIYDIPENIDLYPLMSKVLGVEPSPNNGTMKVVENALKMP